LIRANLCPRAQAVEQPETQLIVAVGQNPTVYERSLIGKGS
jgi:hypothetical protein